MHMYIYIYTHIVSNNNNNGLTQVFFRRGKSYGKLWLLSAQQKTQNKQGRIRQVALDK